MEDIDFDKIGVKVNAIRRDPAMYTLQRNNDVREHQLTLWMHIIYYHCFMNHIYTLTPTDLCSFDVVKDPESSTRSLKTKDINEILSFMKQRGYVITDDDNVYVVCGRNRMRIIANGLIEWAKEDPVDREQMLLADIHDDEKFQTIPVEFLIKVAQFMEEEGEAVYERVNKEPSIKFKNLD